VVIPVTRRASKTVASRGVISENSRGKLAPIMTSREAGDSPEGRLLRMKMNNAVSSNSQLPSRSP
jgi:hypothetical protein